MSGGGGDGSGGGSTLSTDTKVGIANLQRYFAENGITDISINFIYNHYKNGELRWWSYTSDTIDENGNIWKGDIGQFNILRLKESSSVGQPGLGESLMPIWGSGRAAIDHFQNGNYWRGAAYTALAISDVFLVKSLAVGAGKLVVAGFGKLAAEEAATVAAKEGTNYLYHYTSKEAAVSISQQGLNVGRDGFSYLTNVGNLSPLQA